METKTIETPIGKNKIELKQWLTARDFRNIQSSGKRDDVKINFNRDELETINQAGKLEMSYGGILKIGNASEDAQIENVVISVDGKKEDILKRVLEFRKEDFDFLLKAIGEIINEDKKKS